jgi:hypothetical protein
LETTWQRHYANHSLPSKAKVMNTGPTLQLPLTHSWHWYSINYDQE